MKITPQLPRLVRQTLKEKGQLERFFADAKRIEVFVSKGDARGAFKEAARVMAYMAEILKCDPEQLRDMLGVALAKPTPPNPLTFAVPISQRLKEERERLGLSVEQLAEIGFVSTAMQQGFEAGTWMTPPAAHLALLARDAGIDVLYVLTGRREGVNPHA